MMLMLGGPDRTAGFALLRCGVLEASFCARPRSTNRPVRFAHWSPVPVADKSAQVKRPAQGRSFYLAGPTGLEPAISSVTGRRDNRFTTSPRGVLR